MARRLSNWLTSYVEYTRNSEAPEAFHYWSGVSAIAGALRRKCYLDFKSFHISPNMYILFVADPGIAQKSTTISRAMELLRKVPGIKFGPDAVTWQKLVELMGEARERFPMQRTNSVNSIKNMTYFPMSSITLASSELGSFYNPTDESMTAILTDLWDARQGNWSKSTKASGDDTLPNPSINWISCTVPSWLKDNIRENFITSGLASRIVFLYGEAKKQLVPYPQDNWDEKTDKMKEDLLHDLKEIAQLRGTFELSPEAWKWGVEWYHKHHTEALPAHLLSERFKGYNARKQIHLHKLAMAISAARRDTQTIGAKDLMEAEIRLSEIERMMSKVFSIIGMTPSTKHLHTILDVLSQGRIKKSDLYAKVLNQIPHQDFLNACEALAYGKLIETRMSGSDIYVERRRAKVS